MGFRYILCCTFSKSIKIFYNIIMMFELLCIIILIIQFIFLYVLYYCYKIILPQFQVLVDTKKQSTQIPK